MASSSADRVVLVRCSKTVTVDDLGDIRWYYEDPRVGGRLAQNGVKFIEKRRFIMNFTDGASCRRILSKDKHTVPIQGQNIEMIVEKCPVEIVAKYLGGISAEKDKMSDVQSMDTTDETSAVLDVTESEKNDQSLASDMAHSKAATESIAEEMAEIPVVDLMDDDNSVEPLIADDDDLSVNNSSQLRGVRRPSTSAEKHVAKKVKLEEQGPALILDSELKSEQNFTGSSGADFSLLQSGDDTGTNTIYVLDVPDDIVEILELHLESEKNGGGEVDSFSHIKENQMCAVRFVDSKVAENFLNKESLLVDGFHLRVCKKLQNESSVEMKVEEKTKVAEEAESSKTIANTMVEVKGVKPKLTVDVLKLYFENKKRSGGGKVFDITLVPEEERALVTFQDVEVAKRVVEKTQHSLLGCHLECESVEFNSDETPLFSVEVRGLNETISEDMLLLFFENRKRSGGGPVDNVYYNDAEHRAVVTFTNCEVVDRILRNHRSSPLVLSDVRLTVSALRPASLPNVSGDVESNKLLIKSLPEDSSTDDLILFLQRGAGNSVKKIQYSLQPGTAMVHFEDTYDFVPLKDLICSKPFHGVMLIIQKVPVPDSIQIFNIGQLTVDHLMLYFESRKSGGDEVIDSEINPDEDYAILKFADKNVVSSVVSRIHEIEGQKLQVSAYYEGLGVIPPDVDDEKPAWWLPTSMLFNCMSQKLSFIKNCSSLCAKVIGELDKEHCIIEWPELTGKDDPSVPCNILLRCTLTRRIKNAGHLAKTWTLTCQNKMNEVFDEVLLENIVILQELWNTVVNRTNLLYKDFCMGDDVQISMEQDISMIKVTGIKSSCENFVVALKKLVTTAEEELQQQKRMISEQIQKLKGHQFELLKLIGFLESGSDGGVVEVKTSGTDVEFCGLPGDILAKKLKMYEILNNIVYELVDLPDFVLESLRLPPFRTHVSACLKTQNVVSAWDLGPKGLTVYALNQSEIDRTSSVMKSELIQRNVELSSAQSATLMLPAWNLLKDSIKKDFGVILLKESSVSLSLTTISDSADAILENIDCYIKENTINEEFLMMKQGTAVVISLYMKNELQEVCTDFRSCHVSIKEELDAENSGFVISGTVYGLQSAVNKVVEISSKVQEKETILDRPGMCGYLHSTRGKKQIEVIQSRHKVYIEEWEEANQSHLSRLRSKHSKSVDDKPCVLDEVKIQKSFAIKIVHGDITEYEVDAIVNAANGQLDHSGGVARVIADKGGSEIQTECKEFIKAKGKLLPGNCFVSKPGRLPCKCIIHAVGPIWEEGKKNEENILFKTIYSVLEEADCLNLHSVAMPAISTGIYGFPMRKAAKLILEAIAEFAEQEPDAAVHEVHIIDNNRRATDEFQGMLQTMFKNKKHRRSTDDPIVIDDDQDTRKSSRSAFGQTSTSSKPTLSRASSNTSSSLSATTLPSSTVSSNVLTTPEGLKVALVKGSIVGQRVDVIVNTTAQSLVLSNGAVSSLILQTAGAAIQTECQQKAPGGLTSGQVLVTSGYNLPCQFVYHGYCLNWDNGAGSCEKSIRGLLKAVFAEANKSGMTSIAVPAVGTGNLKVPPDFVARIMFEEVEEFSQSNVGTSLTDILFVVYDRDQPTIAAFETELKFPTRHQKQKQRGRRASERILAKSRSATELAGQTSEGAGGWSISIDDVKLEVMQGDITQARTDAIVNSTNESLNLKLGAVSAAILHAGGQEIQDECNKIGKMTDGILVTNAGRLPSKYIFHLKAHSTDRGWRKAIESCLSEAERRRIQSITFPMLGTGNINAPVHSMAAVMLDAVVNFSTKSNPKHLSLIHISIFQTKMVEDFAKAIDEKAREHQSSGLLSRFSVCVKSFFGLSESSSKAKVFKVQEIPVEKMRKYDDRIRFTIYGVTGKSLDAAISDMDDLCSDVIQDKVIEKDAIEKLSDEQISRIEDLEREFPVKITIERGHRVNRIRLQGEGQTFVSALDTIYAIFSEIEEKEREEYQAEIIAQQAQWMYQCDDTYDPYPKPINLIIEKAYQGRLQCAEWEEEDGRYRLDFHQMEETKNGDSSNIVKVKRMTSESSIPKNWDTMNTDELCKRVSLPSTSQEYQDVQRNVNASAGGVVRQLLSIERIQNPSLYQQYVVRREAMERQQQGSSFPSERILWHGTSVDTLESINHHGFNRSYCGKNAVVYGKGVYFAHNFNYSGSNTYAVPDVNGSKYVYQSRVLTGEFVVGNQSYFVAPQKSNNSAARYDSVVDNPAAPTIFVIFSDTQAYPEYLITFK